MIDEVIEQCRKEHGILSDDEHAHQLEEGQGRNGLTVNKEEHPSDPI